jgi:hypothetical protein
MLTVCDLINHVTRRQRLIHERLARYESYGELTQHPASSPASPPRSRRPVAVPWLHDLTCIRTDTSSLSVRGSERRRGVEQREHGGMMRLDCELSAVAFAESSGEI